MLPSENPTTSSLFLGTQASADINLLSNRRSPRKTKVYHSTEYVSECLVLMTSLPLQVDFGIPSMVVLTLHHSDESIALERLDGIPSTVG
jgi:hypothetical protein